MKTGFVGAIICSSRLASVVFPAEELPETPMSKAGRRWRCGMGICEVYGNVERDCSEQPIRSGAGGGSSVIVKPCSP